MKIFFNDIIAIEDSLARTEKLGKELSTLKKDPAKYQILKAAFNETIRA